MRYRQFVTASQWDLVRGGGQWLDTLFLPDAGVVCTFTSEWRVDPAGGMAEIPTMYARFGTLAAELALRPKSAVGEQPPEEIQVSAAFAAEARRLADLTAQVRATSDRLGAQACATGIARPALARDFHEWPKQ
jgi:hypothetical protein